jgi:2-polyprenyl-3-methyl-5-hydroxy-6-metoxy-1,4-benzoquinol methylase
MELVTCNFCGEDNFTVRYNSPIRVRDQENLAHYLASTDRFDRYGQIVQCKKCGLVYTNPRPHSAEVARAYKNLADYEYAEQDSSRSMNANLSLNTIKKYTREGKLLDLGCSTGYFLNVARINFDVKGVEPSKWAVDFAKSKLKLNVEQGDIASVKCLDETFDVISLIDVIEHLTDPIGMLKEAQRLLKANGGIYIVTPNIKSLSARILKGKWWGLRPAHLYYFSPQTLSEMLQKVGFKVVEVRSYGRIFTYGYWLSRIRNYNKIVYRTIGFMIDRFNINEKFLYINTRDSIEVYAKKV